MKVHLAAAEPNLGAVFHIDTGQKLRYHELFLLRVNRRQMTSVQIVAQRFGVIKGEPDVDESVALVLSELEPAGFAGAVLGHCYS